MEIPILYLKKIGDKIALKVLDHIVLNPGLKGKRKKKKTNSTGKLIGVGEQWRLVIFFRFIILNVLYCSFILFQIGVQSTLAKFAVVIFHMIKGEKY